MEPTFFQKHPLFKDLISLAIFIFAITTVINVVGFIVFIIRRATKYMRIILAIIAGVIAMGILFLGSVYP